ncbi:unnamed protein product [Spirodela intermedia]|uniref:Chlorophyll a-b binding protein, chloroplastic n=1 Tax=Spirodela intermedia TaxID=51605 RepID=A0A7I8J3I8_SPIIN|nr:unnamed protein product [Spirodela intermedia]CAA6663910.1 unnamed protein product [Spirodela intermedia]
MVIIRQVIRRRLGRSSYQITFGTRPIAAAPHPPARPFSSSLLSDLHLPPSLYHRAPSSGEQWHPLRRRWRRRRAGVSEMLGSPLNFSGGARSAPAPAAASSSGRVVALFSKKKASAPTNEELAKWYGPDRRIFLPEGLLDRSEVPEYLNGRSPGSNYGYDPFGLSKKPEDLNKYRAYELIHARWAMLGAAGFVIPEAFNKYGANCGPEAVWFKTGALLLDGNTLNYFGKNIPINLIVAVIAEVVLVGGAEYYRIINGLQCLRRTHILSLVSVGLGGQVAPGGAFDPLGLANDPDQAALLKVKEIKNGRLAMFAMLGFFLQAYHLSDPFGNNLLTVISGSAERVPTL